ncbi:GAF and HTH_10 associated domain-containing protein [Halogranum amylolyticum]|uniref:GAF and HTH_10 associated domain-containing protein n=1 Tax=Halogranum amylolyticum TaxID=660520 RepID=A0A1H8W2J9_9EURY|nr:helix-turn-helix domain-containing protein [Halogranum amylolyticum]SEP21865.1 GAF and HTH_10 associated domain-containing protein [Halogranum amylolyticum]
MIAEFHLEAEVLRDSLQAAPDVTVRLEQLYSTPDDPLRNVFWATGAGVDAFEAALPDDESITDWLRLETTEIGRLYRITYAPHILDLHLYRIAGEVDALVLDASASDGVYELRMRFPNRAAFETFWTRGTALGAAFDLQAIYAPQSGVGTDGCVLTDAQRETLLAAFERGYYDIPRSVSLAELATQFGISDQAVSERLRRATRALVAETLVYEAGDGSTDRQPSNGVGETHRPQ